MEFSQRIARWSRRRPKVGRLGLTAGGTRQYGIGGRLSQCHYHGDARSDAIFSNIRKAQPQRFPIFPTKRQFSCHHHSAQLARLMIPTDANVAGNVHGGTIMQLIEEAAGVAANRYFNQYSNWANKVCAMTSRVERMTFAHPVHVGDVAKVHAEVVFASSDTVAISVRVTAERMAWSTLPQQSADTSMICNRALLWLVGVVLPEGERNLHKVNPKDYPRALAPPFPIPVDPSLAYQKAAQSFEARWTNEQEETSSSSVSETLDDSVSPTCFTPDYSAVELVQVMLPSDCTTQTGLVGGGVVMKLMDNACGVAAVRHCGTNVVTIAVDCVHLTAPVLLGDVLRVRAKPTFTSGKSMEIEVSVVAERFRPTASGVLTRQEVVTTERAFFTFVSLPLQSSDGVSSLPMRPLVLKTAQDRVKFEAGKRRYEGRKARRKSQSEQGG